MSDIYSGDLPPVIAELTGTETKTVSRWRWWVHLALLGALPLAIGVIGILGRGETKALLPATVSGLLRISLAEAGYFAVIFLIAWLFSRVNGAQLLLSWRGRAMPVLLGFAYSFALRVAVMVVMLPLALLWVLITGMNAQQLQKLQAPTEHLLDATILVRSPLYLALCLTLLSFVVAGLREELWRAGMFAGFKALFPRQCSAVRGRALMLMIVSLMFGFGHTYQGVIGVGATTLLGLGLGAIMLWHKSIWHAVIAHGFFDTSTFVTLYLLTKYQVGPFHP